MGSWHCPELHNVNARLHKLTFFVSWDGVEDLFRYLKVLWCDRRQKQGVLEETHHLLKPNSVVYIENGQVPWS